MTLSLWTLCVIVPLLLLIEGLFSGSEIALLSADKLSLKKLSKNHFGGYRLAFELSGKPERVLSATLLMTSLCVITNSALITFYFLAAHPRHADILTVLVTSPLVVIFGELIPKTIFQRYSLKLAPYVAYPVYGVYQAFFPITRVLSSYMSRLSKLVGPMEELLAGKPRTTREELRSLLSYTKRETEIKTSAKRMIRRILDFRDSEAKHALIPLVRVEAIEETSTIREALESFERHRHSRMPVFSERIDNVIGVIDASDLFASSDLEQPIRNYMNSPHYVAETQALDELLNDMRLEDIEMVVVVDEHGGAVGILTFEDVIEEIVGEIQDEYDNELALYKELSASSWMLQARMEVQQINEILKLDLPQGEYETLSGFLLQQFGRIPETGDELFFTTPAGSFKFTIRKASERRVESVLVEKIES